MIILREKLSRIFKQLLEEIISFSINQKLFEGCDKLAIGVSGGADSMALLILLMNLQKKFSFQLHVFHFDHRIQAISRNHVRFVAHFCQSNGIPFHLGRNLPSPNPKNNRTGQGISQDCSRKSRMAFFQKKSQELKIRYLALAHNANDQAETILWRLLRGAAPQSLTGISAIRKMGDLIVLRPLLTITRKRIELFLKSLGQEFCQDPSNQKVNYLRNRIRKQLIPLLEQQYNPQVQKHLCQMAWDHVRENEVMEASLKAWLSQNLPEDQKKFSNLCWPRERLQECPQGLRYRLYLHLMKKVKKLKISALNRRHLQTMEELIYSKQGGQLALPGGWTMRVGNRNQGYLVQLVAKTLRSPLVKSKERLRQPGV